MPETQSTGDDGAPDVELGTAQSIERDTSVELGEAQSLVRPVTDAMIVAGGRGTRLQPLTHDTPKPLLDFCGKPFLAGVIDRLAAAGVTRVFLVVGADTSPFEILRPLADEVGVSLVMVPEPEPLDTAGGVREAAEQVDDAFFVLNGDILHDLDLTAQVERHRSSGADATLHLVPVEDTSTFGVCVLDDDGMITSFVEKPAPGTLPGQHNINAGTYILEPEAIRAFPSGRLSFERAVFSGILERGGTIAGHVAPGVWADLGTPERWREGHRRVLDGEVHWPAVAAVPQRAPDVRVHPAATVDRRANLVGPVLVLEGASVAPGAVIGPHVVVGQQATIGEGVHLSDTVVGRGATVGDGVRTSQLLMGTRTRLGVRARVGRDVVLGEAVRIPDGKVLNHGARVPAPRG